MAIIYGKCKGASASKFDVWLDVKQNSQNQAKNESNVTVRMHIKRNDNVAYSIYNLETKGERSLKIDGDEKDRTPRYIDTRNFVTVTLAEWTGNIEHNIDGTKTLKIEGSFTVPGEKVPLDGGSISGEVKLTPINVNVDPPKITDFSVTVAGSGALRIIASAKHPEGITDAYYRLSSGNGWTRFAGTAGTVFALDHTEKNLNYNTTYKPAVLFVAKNKKEATQSHSGILPFVPVGSISINGLPDNPINMAGNPENDIKKFTVSVKSTGLSNPSNPDVTVRSSDTDVFTAAISKTTGTIKLVGPGEANLIATAADGSGKMASIPITVCQKVTGIRMNTQSIVLNIDGEECENTCQLSCTVLPNNASNKKVTFTATVDQEDKNVVEVSETGLVTALTLGECIITATTVDGEYAATVNCRVTGSFEWRNLRYFGEYLNHQDVFYVNENLWYTRDVCMEHCGDSFPYSDKKLVNLREILKAGYTIPFDKALYVVNNIEENIFCIVNNMDCISETYSVRETTEGGHIKYDNSTAEPTVREINGIPTIEQVNKWVDFLNELHLIVAGPGAYADEDNPEIFHPNRVLKAFSDMKDQVYELRDNEGFRLLVSDDPEKVIEAMLQAESKEEGE